MPPVTFTSSLPAMPLSDELMTSVPLPFRTRSSFEKMAASAFSSALYANAFFTVSVLVVPEAVVTNTLSDDAT